MAFSENDDANFSENLPRWLELARIPDTLFLEAYENCPAAFRGAIKTGIALAFSCFQHFCQNGSKLIKDRRKGFSHLCEKSPLDWTILVFEDNFSAAARLCAAAILPVLADVPRIFALACGKGIAPGALLSLELCGITDAFQIAYEELAQFYDYLLKAPQFSPDKGKIILLGEKIAQIAQPKCLERVFINLPQTPNIKIENPELFNKDLLKFAQGSAIGNFNPAKSPDCIFAASLKTAAEYESCPLVLGPGCEGFWLYPNLDPDNFTLSQNSFSLIDALE